MDDRIKKIAQETLRGYGVRVRTRPGRPPEGLAGEAEVWVLDTDRETTLVLAAELRRDAPPAVGGWKATGAAEAGGARAAAEALPRLWVAEHVPAARADRLIAAGDGFVDVTGNAHLQLPGILIHVERRRAPRRKPEDRIERHAYREWRRPALRLLFRILCEPALAEEPYTSIAEAAGIAPGTVTHLFADLEGTGNLVRLGGRGRRFVPDAPLVARWLEEYERKLYPRNLLGRYEAAADDWWKRFDPAEHEALWGGEPAAELLGAPLRPGIRTLYTALPPRTLIRAARLRPDPRGRVELRGTFWNGALPTPRPDLVHPLLVVADLLATRDGRCAEAARQIQEERG